MFTDFSNMPKDWAVCFMHDCILKEQCLRYHAGKALPIGQHSTLTVLPSARSGNNCKAFYAMKTERLAWGFSHLSMMWSTVTTALCVVLWRVISEVALFIIVTIEGLINWVRANSNGLTNSSCVMAMLPHVFMIITRRAGNNSSVFGKELRSEREW